MKRLHPIPQPLFLVCALLMSLGVSGCVILAGRAKQPMRNEVFVMGTLREGHLREAAYDLERVGELLRQLDPDLVLVQLPPERFETAWSQFLETGQVAEERTRSYPEFTEVLFPIGLEGRFRILPCSAWTQELEDRRTALLNQWKSTRPADTQAVNDARATAQRELASRGIASDPLGIHTEEYDRIVAAGMEPYERIFGDDLGAAGWRDMHLADYVLIDEVLDGIEGNDLRVLIMVEAWHKYRLRELLGEREDIHLLRLPQVAR